MQKEGLEKYLDIDGKIIAWPNTADGKQIARKLIARKPDGSAYWKVENDSAG